MCIACTNTAGHAGINACGEDSGPARKCILDEAGIHRIMRVECQEDVQIRNDDKAKLYPLLWMRGRDG